MPALGGGQPFGLGGLGVEPGLGLLDQPAQLRGPDLVRERRDLGVHERRRLRGQAQGAVGDEPEPPRRQLTGLEPGPAPWEPVVALDRVGEVAAPGLGGPAHRGGELDDRELRHLRTPLATQRQAGLVPLIDRPDQRLTRVHRRPRRGGLASPRGRRRPRPASVPARRPARRRGRRSSERERVEGRGHRGTNSTTSHRHSKARNPLIHKGFRDRDKTVTSESTPSHVVTVSTSPTRSGRASAQPTEGFETGAERPPQPPRDGSQPGPWQACTILTTHDLIGTRGGHRDDGCPAEALVRVRSAQP